MTQKGAFQLNLERALFVLLLSYGESGIRTHGGLRHTAFREPHHRPLGHLSNVMPPEGIEPTTPSLGRRRSIH